MRNNLYSAVGVKYFPEYDIYMPYGYYQNYYKQQALELVLDEFYKGFETVHAGALSAVVGVGNYLTRNFRQKIILDNDNTMPSYVRSGLTNYKRKGMSRPKTVKSAQKASKRASMNRKNKKARKVAKKVVSKSIAGVSKQIDELRKKVGVTLSKHVYKKAEAGSSLQSLVGRCSHTLIEPVTPTKLEGYMANFRFFNPSAPSTLVTSDISSGTYAKDVKVKNIHSKLHFSVVNMTPVHLRVYLCKPKRDTATTPLEEYTNGIADQVITASIDETDALLYITDIERVRENWEIDCVLDKVLPNGSIETVSHNTGEFDYDPSHTDSETVKYQKRNKAFAWVIRCEGTLGHDNTTPFARTLLNVDGVDYMHTIKADFEYDAGIQLNDIYISENRAQTGTSFITGVPVIPDNIAPNSL